MTNRSSKCKICNKNKVKSIYFRDDDKKRSFIVAFRVCIICPLLFDFIDFEVKPHRHMPYYNEIDNLSVRLFPSDSSLKWKRIMQMRRIKMICKYCSELEYSRLYLRVNRVPKYVGYLCKKCKTVYFVKRSFFNPNTLDPKGYHTTEGKLPEFHDIPFKEYMGSYTTRPGVPTGEVGYQYLNLRVKSKDVPKLKRLLSKHRIEVEGL